MSQEKKSLTYKVKLSYYVKDIDNEGVPTTRQIKDAEVEVLRLQRLNKEHSKLALRLLTGKSDMLDIAPDFVACTVVDDAMRKDILEDMLACFHLANSEEAKNDLDSFFGNWDFLKNPIPAATGNK